jgi:class 3 adenylate cyclase
VSLVWLVVAPETPDERLVRVSDRVHIGRECAGVPAVQRILIDSPQVSRDHAEVQLIGGAVQLVDHSTNGTRVNGRRVERGERVTLNDGDRLTIGDVQLTLQAPDLSGDAAESGRTIAVDSVDDYVVLVGDAISYTRLNELHGPDSVGVAFDGLFTELARIVVRHGGTVTDFAGDAILAIWELAADPGAARDAVECAFAADRYVVEAAARFPLRYEDDSPIRLGWALTTGRLATSHPTPARVSVRGDAVNLAFRLAGVANRGDAAAILAESAVVELAPDAAKFGEPFSLTVKGRRTPAEVRPATAR